MRPVAAVAQGLAGARPLDLARDLDPHLLADPYWPELADHLSLAARAGLDVHALARDALADNPLPTEMPAAALWWRLCGTLTPAALETANGGLRREPELPEHVAIVPETSPPPAQEFSIVEDDQDDAARQAAVRRRMQGIARQASLDPGDGIEL